jgi:broad specificity phosphatase PhoE
MESELFKHDPGIKSIGVEKSKRVAEKLVAEYGEPVRIISSPYRRARETAMVMNSVLKNPVEEIIIDRNISEYLGNHPESPLDVTPATKIHNPPHPETLDDLKKRVDRHIQKMYKQDHNDPTAVVWIITHGIVMKQVTATGGIRNAKNFPCLTCVSVIETPELKKCEFLVFYNRPKQTYKKSYGELLKKINGK